MLAGMAVAICIIVVAFPMTLIISNFNKYYFEAQHSTEECSEENDDEKQLNAGEKRLQDALNTISEVHEMFACKIDALKDQLKAELGGRITPRRLGSRGGLTEATPLVRPRAPSTSSTGGKRKRRKLLRIPHSRRNSASESDFVPIPGLPFAVVEVKRNNTDK